MSDRPDAPSLRPRWPVVALAAAAAAVTAGGAALLDGDQAAQSAPAVSVAPAVATVDKPLDAVR
ncbi:MAG: hypothetical protein M3R46_10790, partial [Actinomycetota bacterium]|nr:hypothetical protein [Actinomycetota bacterium]